jgi:hypothetical protein
MLEQFLQPQPFHHINDTEFNASFETWYMRKDQPDLFSYWNSYKSVQTEEGQIDSHSLT